MLQISESAGEKLREIDGRIRGLRQERSRAQKLADAAKKTALEIEEGAPGYDAAKQARESVREMDHELEALQEDQVALLREVDRPLGIIGAGGDGWAIAAANLDLERSLRVNVSAQSLLQAQAAPVLPTTPTTPGLAAQPPSSRWLYPVFEALPFAGIGEVVATDFTVSFSQSELTGGPTGEIERDPDQTSPAKAELTPTIALATVSAKTYAVTLTAPTKVFDSKDALLVAAVRGGPRREAGRHVARPRRPGVHAAHLRPPHGRGSRRRCIPRRGCLHPRVCGLAPQIFCACRPKRLHRTAMGR